ncbi:MAG: imidazole glycerol phosphate synthase subunit HisF [Candidatus Marinimicrobia bacterium]|nr:imidazole glycerol phosphate synthase subunit HisF [Candidatus Neomarinimicrobiota bacterium]
MLSKRIIPCLDIKNGQTVKGINFVNLRNAGDPVELGKAYAEQGADELVFLDITATIEKRDTLLELVRRIAKNINIPFTVGGGIRKEKDVEKLLNAGADKISINSSAVKNPQLISNLKSQFGSQCIVLAIDAKWKNNDWFVYTHGGRISTNNKVIDWSKKVADLGAGEILLTSMDHDGTKNGFAISLTKTISELVNIPIIASGGAGNSEHFAEIFTKGKADAGLAASIFHFGEIRIPKLKEYLKNKNIEVRI